MFEDNENFGLIMMLLVYAILVAIAAVIVVGLLLKRHRRNVELDRKTAYRVSHSAFTQTAKTREERIGESGETRVSTILRRISADKDFYIVNDLLFSDNRGHSTQIDHVFINQSGLWIIETKNRAGEIHGKEEDERWTQVLANGNVINTFYNPVKQNQTHLEQLKRRLNISVPMYSVVVFLKADLYFVESRNVCNLDSLKSLVWTNTNAYLSPIQTKSYFEMLCRLKASCKITKEQHVENIKQKYSQLENGSDINNRREERPRQVYHRRSRRRGRRWFRW